MKTIAIVGAGLVGSLAAIYFAKRGYAVNVYERRPDMRKLQMSAGRSINLALSERGWRGLRGAGIEDEIRKVAIPMHGRMIHSISGEQSFQRYGLPGQSIYSVSRGGINMTLMDCAERFDNIRFHFNRRCSNVNIRDGILELENTETGQIEVIAPDVIIGADGANSQIRLAMQSMDRFNYAQHYIEHGYKELAIPAAADGSWLLDKNALHIWPRQSYMLIALPNLDGSFTCTLFLAFEGKPSFAELQTQEATIQFLQEQFPDALDIMPTAAEDFETNPTSSLITVRCYPWSYSNKVLLLGDSAHGLVPFFGQGMNCGFEDCTILDELLDKYSEDNWDEMFRDFEQIRKPNAEAIADMALENFIEMRDNVADKQFLLRKRIESLAQLHHPTRFLPRYSMVSFSSIPYSEAVSIGLEQDNVINRILALENLEQMLDSGDVLAPLENAIGILPERFGDYSPRS